MGQVLGLSMETFTAWTSHTRRMLERQSVRYVLASEGIEAPIEREPDAKWLIRTLAQDASDDHLRRSSTYGTLMLRSRYTFSDLARSTASGFNRLRPFATIPHPAHLAAGSGTSGRSGHPSEFVGYLSKEGRAVDGSAQQPRGS
jgi:hypothetical protein